MGDTKKNIDDILRFLLQNNIDEVSEIKIRQLYGLNKQLSRDQQIISIIETFNFKSKRVSLRLEELKDLQVPYFFIESFEGDYVLVEIKELIKAYNDKSIFENKFKLNPNGISCIFFEKNRSKKSKSLLNIITDYIIPYRKFFYQVLYGIIVITLLQFISPFLMQLFIDKGIIVENLSLIKIVIFGLLAVQIGKFLAEFVRSWLYLHIGIRINISMISDFITNVMKLPIHYFNTSTIGEILQRVEDNKRIENFLTKSIINFIFNIITILIFLIILGYFNQKIFIVFIVGNILFIAWILLFWRIRKKMDTNIFKFNSRNQNLLIQLLQSVQEIKLYGIEKEKRWDWEDNQIELYKNKQKMMIVEQLQDGVSLLINESKNYLIFYLCAISIIDGTMSFGIMIAIQYIIGQTNMPIRGITNFIMEYQMALISFKRINDINLDVETKSKSAIINNLENPINIDFQNVTFQYQDYSKSFSLKNINLKFPPGKTTAIIGRSGSGKTTVLKLILKFYNPYKGDIHINGINIRTIDIESWRDRCGALLQDSIIFNDTILNNITMGKEYDFDKLMRIAKMSEILEFVESKNEGFNTTLSYGGKGLSQGQIQRLLIARLMYKNPDVVLLDEITSSLDPKTEKSIMDNLKFFFKDKTVIIISHKISTVMHADHFIVMNEGKVLEYGNHDYLMEKNGYYASLHPKE
ncbi:peptidase domain-containing ABC transporter [Chryseobacterium lathyri]|jgi:ATP-binding cassette subfamily B protein|uniref:ABC transporter ATP-binding protein n=1 Tax=Chryseobacterium lathyri TaxID=395933 RepID=A0A511YER7_9FLAO|nr:peptidase domain-containing ABC transporter [Chryseobacterium lathyri]GEN73673.1 ABC transporter ATP-binding protein [Chryseobacterium lathyri]